MAIHCACCACGPTLDEGVTVEGHVFRPAQAAWQEGLRLTDVLGSVDELKPNADLNYVLIRRELPPDRRITAVSADLAAALRDPASARNIKLMPRDRIIVFDVESGRRQVLDPLLEEIRRQSRIDQPGEIVRIDGRVKARGDYPLEPQMRVSDLLRAGGGLQDAAYGAKAELTRYRVSGDVRQTQLLDVDLAAILKGDASADLMLQPFDFLNVKEVPEWSEQEQVALLGEVRFPGHLSDPARRNAAFRADARGRTDSRWRFPKARCSRAWNCRSANRNRSIDSPNGCRAIWRRRRCRRRPPTRAGPDRRSPSASRC